MFNFIKKLFGVKTPVTAAAQAPYKVEPASTTTYIETAKPVIKTEVVVTPAANDAIQPAKKRRHPRNRKPKTATAGGTVAKVGQPKPAVTEGKTKGGNGAVKQPKANAKKPKAPAKAK